MFRVINLCCVKTLLIYSELVLQCCQSSFVTATASIIIVTRRVPIYEKSSVCLICMKYRIIILIMIILSLGKISLSYIANTSRTHARTHARAHSRTQTPPPPRPSMFAVSVRPISPTWLGAPLSTLARQWPVGDPLK